MKLTAHEKLVRIAAVRSFYVIYVKSFLINMGSQAMLEIINIVVYVSVIIQTWCSTRLLKFATQNENISQVHEAFLFDSKTH